MFSDILLMHIKKYPLLQPSDIVKLCFQSEFGVAHFVSQNCLVDIEKEYASIDKSGADEKYTSIGNGFVRVSLKALKKEELPRLAKAFVNTSRQKSGSKEAFSSVLREALRTVNENEGLFSFSASDFDAFLREYESLGYPPVRHSEIYRSSYKPSYRVVKSDYVNFISREDVYN